MSFTEPIPLTVANLAKIASATDPRTSSLAVYSARGHLSIWGLIDQQNRCHDFVNYDSEAGPERPRVFQATAMGIGHLAVYMGYEKVAELRLNVLMPKSIDVFSDGPVAAALAPDIVRFVATSINRHHKALGAEVSHRHHPDLRDWGPQLSSLWLETLKRLLLRMQNLRHGGALLLTPDRDLAHLNVKYAVSYDRLRKSLATQGQLLLQHTRHQNEIHSRYLETTAEDMPVLLHLDESVTASELEDAKSELDGAIWFVSLLSRVDGLVLLSPDLRVKGFGVEITAAKNPDHVFLAADEKATPTLLRKVDYTSWGTRHRSMMRYCSQVPASVGFVVSQDGDIRAVTQVGRRLVMWENVLLKLEFPETRHGDAKTSPHK